MSCLSESIRGCFEASLEALCAPDEAHRLRLSSARSERPLARGAAAVAAHVAAALLPLVHEMALLETAASSVVWLWAATAVCAVAATATALTLTDAVRETRGSGSAEIEILAISEIEIRAISMPPETGHAGAGAPAVCGVE